jgi:hypothetical protein
MVSKNLENRSMQQDYCLKEHFSFASKPVLYHRITFIFLSYLYDDGTKELLLSYKQFNDY